jgi:hypothetical protein
MIDRVPEKVEALQKRHPVLRYESYALTPSPEGLKITYSFHLAPSYTFTPTITIPGPTSEIDGITERLAFLIGMVELLSYWKLACPPRIEVVAGSLSELEIQFWEGLLRRGLGEFFYLNQIPPSIQFSIVSSKESKHLTPGAGSKRASISDSFLVLVGGGKDSIVTLELLKRASGTNDRQLGSFVLNPIPASIEAIRAAGFPSPLRSSRSLDPQLLELNRLGYLNGHTPFSALLAFVSTLVAYRNGFRHVLASNESSASEGNISYMGYDINHQYSKSFDFEEQFRTYISLIGVDVEYASFLRPINELQICALFATFEHQHRIFRSCNREQTLRARQRELSSPDDAAKIRGWCAECPKCIFTYLCLSCFISQERISEIFGINPSSTPNFVSTARELAGFAEHKPFECVGTYEEVCACLAQLFSSNVLTVKDHNELHALITSTNSASAAPVREILTRWNTAHFVPSDLAGQLRAFLSNAVEGLIR